MRQVLFVISCFLLVSCNSETESESTSSFEWNAFDKGVFEKAQKEDKLVLLDIGANWCHWCHVMDEKTYDDPQVQEFLSDNFILAREDQDSRPDLYAAYKNWGWPAIIVFNADKEELLKLKGYQEKTKFMDILQKTLDNPTPITKEIQKSSELSSSDQELYDFFIARIDHEKGMYNSNHKYIQVPGMEHGFRNYKTDDTLRKWVDLTIKNSYSLVDPVWSGVYQYSTKKSWINQHYEKLLRVQANYMKVYARYGLIAKDKKAIQMAESIYEYCEGSLGTETPLFYNSQNADVIPGEESDEYYAKSEQERLEIGIPSVDTNIYLKENAMVAQSLLYLWASTNNDRYLNRAIEMTDFILEGNFDPFKGTHARSISGPYIYSFEDNRQLLEHLMKAYQATGYKEYLEEAQNLGDYLIRDFYGETGMRASFGGSPLAPVVMPVDNLNAAMTYNLLGHLSGEERFLEIGQKLFDALDKKQMARKTSNLPLLIKAKKELENEPFHAVLITDGSDEKMERNFYMVILEHTDQYIVFERARMHHFTEEQELLYSGTPSGTLFMCTSSYCSAPITNLIGLQEFLESN